MTGVDVVVPCYNYAGYLEWCVGTLLNQQGVRVRVLIIDDASDDETPDVGRRLAAGDPRVEFRRHDKNAGHIATYNEGMLDWASAEYSLLISADDGLAPGALARATRLMAARPGAGLTYGMATIITDDHGPADAGTADADHRIVTAPRFIERCCRVGNPVTSPTAVVRTAIQKRLGGYRADLPHTADMEMWMRFALHGEVGVLRAVQAYYRCHGRNLSSGYYARLLGDRREQILAFRDLESRLGAVIPEFPSWFAAMGARLGRGAIRVAHEAFESGDDDGYRECVAFAAEVFPGMRRSGVWMKLRMKQLMGRRALRRVRPLWSRLRGGVPTPVAPVRAGATFRPGAMTGWWPDDTR